MEINSTVVVVRGAGDLATGIIHCLFSCGFKVVALETNQPTAIRRTVAFSEVMYDGLVSVEGVSACKVTSYEDIQKCWGENRIPILADPQGDCIEKMKPDVVVDAIIAKKNLGTKRNMAPLVIGVGPGFVAKEDVDLVIETNRGHRLGRIITEGAAAPNTGVPGVIAGVSKERVIHSANSGIMKNVKTISDIVQKGDIIAYVGDEPVKATISGVLRGLLRDGLDVPERFKIADIDPRITEKENCFSISDKSRTIAGGVLQAILMCGDCR